MRLTKARNLPATGTLCISLADGADEQECPGNSVKFSGGGMYFQSRWCFAPCTVIDLVFSVIDRRCRRRRYIASGMVVECTGTGGLYKTALHFIEPLRKAAHTSRERRLALN